MSHSIQRLLVYRIGTCLLIQLCSMTEDIVCYVLRNSPLRVVKVSRATSDTAELPTPRMPGNWRPQSPNIVTLESILSECPLLTQEVLQQKSDNQLVAFWSEVAIFCVVGPVLVENKTWYDAEFYHFEINSTVDGLERKTGLDKKPDPDGKTDWCTPSDKNDAICKAGQGEFEFVLLATNATPGNAPEKVVLQVFFENGIAYRICAASIKEDKWVEAKPKRQLVVLG